MQCAYMYPRMMSLGDVDALEVGEDGMAAQLPLQLNLSADRMSVDGAFLLENGEEA